MRGRKKTKSPPNCGFKKKLYLELLHVHYYNLLPSFKLVKEKDPKFVQDFIGAGRELNSLDSQSRKVFTSSGITGYIIVSLEHSVLEWLIVSKVIFLGQCSCRCQSRGPLIGNKPNLSIVSTEFT